MNKSQFGQYIKQKYPAYVDQPDEVLADMVLKKYPSYSSMVETPKFTFSGDRKTDISNDIESFGGDNLSAITQYYQEEPEDKAKREQLASLRKQAEEKGAFNKTAVENAKGVLDVMSSLDPNDPAYNDKLNFAASKLAAHVGFGIGGKVLSEAEKALLQPQIPMFAKSKTVSKGSLPQRIWGGLTGAAVPEVETTNEVLQDTPDKLYNKTMSMINMYGTEEDKKKYAGFKPKIGTGKTPQVQGSVGNYIGKTIGNIPGDIGNIAKGVVSLPGVVLSNEMKRAQSGKITNPADMTSRAILAVGEAWLQNLYKDIGSPTADSTPEQIGDNVASNFQERPVSTLLDIAPFTQLGKIGRAGKGASAVEGVPKSLPEIGAETVKQTSTAGRAATGVGVIDTQSVLRSEKLMGEALKMTKSLSRRNMAKELGSFNGKASDAIRTYVKNSDKSTGLLSLEEYVDALRIKLSETSAGQQNPAIVEQVVNDTMAKLQKGNIGDKTGTSLEAINDLRTSDNSGLTSYYKRGMPKDSPSDVMDALKAERSNFAKEFISDTTKDSKLKQLIYQQHVAIQAEPVLSEMALSVPQTHSFWQYGYQALKRAFNSVTEPIQIKRARVLQGKGGVEFPEYIPSENTPVSSLPSIEYVNKNKPLSSSKPPTIYEESGKLKRDMRTKQGNPKFNRVRQKAKTK